MKDKRNYLIVYHEEDNDGVFSGALLYDYLINVNNVDEDCIKTIPATYNTIGNILKYNTVEELRERYDGIILTDISLPEKDMLLLYKAFGNDLLWFDHHSPIIKASYALGFDQCLGIRNTSKSAILCVYEFLYDQLNVIYQDVKPGEEHPEFPELLRILSAYDSWSYEREGYEFDYVNAINKGVTHHYNLNFEKIVHVVATIRQVYHENEWSEQAYLYETIKNMHELGTFIIEYEDRKNANLLATVGDMTWIAEWQDKETGHPIYRKCAALFIQGPSNSTMFYSLKKTHPDIRHGLVFKRNNDSTWVISMYNVYNDDWFHCGEYLKENYKGGGHVGAAGCQVSEEQFIEILKKKKI